MANNLILEQLKEVGDGVVVPDLGNVTLIRSDGLINQLMCRTPDGLNCVVAVLADLSPYVMAQCEPNVIASFRRMIDQARNRPTNHRLPRTKSTESTNWRQQGF